MRCLSLFKSLSRESLSYLVGMQFRGGPPSVPLGLQRTATASGLMVFLSPKSCSASSISSVQFCFGPSIRVYLWGASFGPLSHPPLRSTAAPGWSACRPRSSMAFCSGISPECPRLPEIVVESQFQAARAAIPAPECPSTGGSPGSATVPCCPPVHRSAAFLLHVLG